MKAISLIFKQLTPSDFNGINGAYRQAGGGGQTYIDFSRNSIPDEYLDTFFGSGSNVSHGKSWNIPLYSLSLSQSPQTVTIGARNESSNALRDQSNNPVYVWDRQYTNQFPTTYNAKEDPIVVFIVKANNGDENSYWAGWFLKSELLKRNINLSYEQLPLITEACGFIKFSVPVNFDTTDRIWPFVNNQDLHKNTLLIINNNSMSDKYISYLAALRTKPFMLLAGISGTGKSRIVRKLAQASVTEGLQKQYDPESIKNGFKRWELHKPANFELVQVKPNWHNSLEVIGYKSNIGGEHYEYTPFVKFIARAWKHQDLPFFLCLDEMNLAPVEQYFAEFLSAIESRSFENKEYETDPIIKPFKEFGEKLCNDMLDYLIGKVDASQITDSDKAALVERFKNKGLTLPQNLFVLGTVNMDETTFSFSRKVLDRAMSVVMNDVEYDKFFNGESEYDMAEMSADTIKKLIKRPIKGIEAEENDSVAVKTYLTAINNILNNTPFKLGYRAANEALLYVSAAHLLGTADTTQALDEFTMMKILSRIEGDKRSIGTILTDLQTVITDAYPKSNKKLGEMARTLSDKQFVSFWN